MKNHILLFIGLALPWLTYSQPSQEISFGLGNARVIKYSPSGDLIAIAVGSKIKLIRSGIQVATLNGSGGGKVNSLDFNQDGEFLISGLSNGKVAIWEVKTRKLSSQFKAYHYPILQCQFLESGNKIALLTKENLSIWTSRGALLHESFNHYGHNTAMAKSANDELFITSDTDRNIVFRDNHLEVVKRIKSNQKWVLSLALTPNGKILASGGTDGTIDLWNTEHHSFRKTLLDTDGRINSMEFSSDNKYLSAGGQYFFILSMNDDHPDVVYKKLNGNVLSSSFNPNGKEVCIIEDLTTHFQVFDIRDLNIPPVFRLRDDGDLIAPQIYISNPPKITNDRINFSEGMIAIKGSIFDDYGVRKLTVNGIETPIKENGKFIIHLPLSSGENPVELEAKDVNGNMSLKKFIINRTDGNQVYDHQVARNYLFVVGIDDYQDWPMLNNAVRDGNDLATIMMEQYGFQFSDITFLKNEQATKNNIFKGLRGMIEKVTPQDNLLIYFSGHGHFDELLNEGYWIPADARHESPADYLSNTSILKMIESINTQHTLLIADACFSGSLFTDTHRSGYYDKVDRYRSRWGLASGRLEAVSDGAIGANSPFSIVLLDFLKENEKREFAVSEMIQYVKMKVSEISDQTPIGNPLRIKGEEGGEFIFRRSASQ